MATVTHVEETHPGRIGGVILRRVWTWSYRHLLLVAGLVPLVFIISTAVLAPTISPHDMAQQDLRSRLLPPAWMEEGNPEHPLGADQLGRDIMTRIFFGGRVSLMVGLSATLGAGTLGALLGLAAGYLGGRVEILIMTIADLQLAMPFVVLAIAIASVVGPGMSTIIILLIVTQWAVFGRVMRAQVLSLKESDFVLAARATGVKDIDIVFRHILPNALGPILALAIPLAARMILAEAALSFLGLGVQPPTPTWGGMLADGRSYLHQAPWISIFPGLAIMITVLGMNLLAEWVRVALDPKQRQ